MKAILLFVFLLSGSLSYCQIIFEAVTIPADFNITAVRQSPEGEYFVQAVNDEENIYTSTDGIEWVKVPLPVKHRLDILQVFNDGTPLLQSVLQEHLIRRNGVWHEVYMPGFGNASASFIKEDTLFAFRDKTIAYSLDKGVSFTQVFTYPDNIIYQTAQLWKVGNSFALLHTSGSSHRLSVFSATGKLIVGQTLELLSATTVYNECEQVLIYAPPQTNKYYLITGPEFHLQEGVATDLIPGLTTSRDIYSQDGHYYFWKNNVIYKSTGCNFEWEEVAVHDYIDGSSHAWIGHHGDIFLYDQKSNHFIRKDSDSDIWEVHHPAIDYPLVFNVGESAHNKQFVLTSNYLFHKELSEPAWNQRDSIGGLNYQVQYSPNGALYMNRGSHLDYSVDNGENFMSIQLPQNGGTEPENYMHLLHDGIIFISNRYSLESYYTLNNGQDWTLADVSFPLTLPYVKLIDDHILTIDLNKFTASRINTTTNEVITEQISNSSFDWVWGAVILDDGSVYIPSLDLFNDNLSLFRYRFGEGVDYVGRYNELINARLLTGSGTDLFAFAFNAYYIFDGETLEEYEHIGLPHSYADLRFTLSDNNTVYAIVDNNKVFRSSSPVVSSKEVQAPVHLKLYPNPTYDFISISVSESTLKLFDSYEIIDVLGCRVQSNDLTGSLISVSNMTPGIYTLLLKGNWNVLGVEKFIKL